MATVAKALIVYGGLLLILRITGKRTLAQITIFDFVLLLVIAEATQQALLGNDNSITTALLVILTLVAVDRLAASISYRSDSADRLLNDLPLILVEHGKPHEDRMSNLRVTLQDIVDQGRATQGIERLDQIKYAVIERNGTISVVPKGEDD
jgi:uncharacterized membrane protein YcaP (DUF421 family)